jgi:serine protease AprX
MSTKTIHNTIVLFIVCALVATMTGVTPSAPSQPVKVIVQGTSVESAAAAVYANEGHVTAEVGIINAVVAEVPSVYLARLAESPGVVRVTPDREVQKAGNSVDVEFAKAIGVQEVWDSGNLGQGVTIAILDSGIDTTFRHLRRPFQDGQNRILAYYDVLSGQLYEPPRLKRSPRDPNGHGTHIAGIIGNSAYERRDQEYRGIAPESTLVAVRVLDEAGMGSYGDVLQGIDWVVQNKDAYGIRVLNMSLYAPAVAPYWADPYNLAVMAAWQAGIVVVASAGNDGPDPMSIGVPGNTPYIITVGAFTDNYTPEDLGDDYMPPFSATGPTLDAFVKPDLIAPGAHVISLMRRNTYLDDLYPDNRVNRRYFRMTGTSVSAAMVSGITALMLSENPDLTPDQVKYRLTVTARPQFNEYDGEAAYSIWEQGAGRVWASDAVFTDVEGAANEGMDIAADLAGEQHYEGWTVYDPDTNTFQVRNDSYTTWAGGYNTWAGGYTTWAGGYWPDSTNNWSGGFNDWLSAYGSWSGGYNTWAGDYNTWAGDYNTWAGGYPTWAGDYPTWAGGYTSWAGGYTSWAGGYTSWAGGYTSWAGGYTSWAGSTGDPEWAEAFVNLTNAPTTASSVGINVWVDDGD